MSVRMLVAIGVFIALASAIIAFVRSRRPATSYYADEVYEMGPPIDRIYAFTGALLAALLLISIKVRQIPGILLLGATALYAVLYFTSFARGFSDEQ